MEFYLYLNGLRRGPFPEERIRSLLAEGLLRREDLASERADGGWKPLAMFEQIIPIAPLSERSEAPPLVVSKAEPLQPRTLPWTLVSRPDLPRLASDTLGPYARSTLAADETPYYKTSLHWIIFARFAAMGFALFLLAAIPFAIALQALTGWEIGWYALPLPALLLLPPAIAFASSELVITDRRVLVKTGVIRRQTLEMFIAKVESIAVDQSFLGRFFDYGTVVVRGTGGFEEPFEAIARPLVFRDWVQRLQNPPGG